MQGAAAGTKRHNPAGLDTALAAMKPGRLGGSGVRRLGLSCRDCDASLPSTCRPHTMNTLSQRESHLGPVPSSSTNSFGNFAVYEECLAIRRRLVKVDPHNTHIWPKLIRAILSDS